MNWRHVQGQALIQGWQYSQTKDHWVSRLCHDISVARRHPTPTSLDDEDSYKFMVDQAIDSKTNISASITIEPVVPESKMKV